MDRNIAQSRDDFLKGLIIVSLIALFSFYSVFTNTINYDVSWLLHATSEMMQGKKLYQDIIEINPPLIIWLQVPAYMFSEVFGFSIKTGMIILTGIACGYSIILSNRLAKKAHCTRPLLMLTVLSLILFILPSWNFGQREHLFIALTLPYFFLIFNRSKKIEISPPLAIVVGIIGAIGFNIKPYFLLVPLALELYLIFAIGLRNIFKRIEPYLVGLITVFYFVLILIFTPEYFSKTGVGYAFEIYSSTFNVSGTRLSQKLSISFILLGLACLIWLCQPRSIHRNPSGLFLVGAFATLAVVVIQGKGWTSHQLPIMSFAVVAISFSIPAQSKGATKINILLFAATIFISIVLWSFLNRFDNNDQISYYQNMNEIIETQEDVNSIFIMSSDLLYGFPLITETNLKWGSRFGALSLTAGVRKRREDLAQSTELLDEIEHYVWTALAYDLKINKPDLVLVDTNESKNFISKPYDFIKDYSKNSDFRAEWSNYELKGASNGMDIYRRQHK